MQMTSAFKGEYVSKRRLATLQKQALDSKIAADLWTLSEKLDMARMNALNPIIRDRGPPLQRSSLLLLQLS